MMQDGEVREWGTHLVSNTGEVRWKGRPDVVLRCVGARGYAQFRGKRVYGKKKGMMTVHIAVAKLFVRNPKPATFTEVDHADGNKLNNHWRNLRWVNRSLNCLNKGKGYHQDTRRKTPAYQIQVKHHGKKHSYGTVHSEDEAEARALEVKADVFKTVYMELTGLDNAGVGDEMYLS
jgi:hypothetical protein